MTPNALTVALAGNPNAGKSTIFNALTGGRQHVGNYPGVTVECHEGAARHDGADLRIVDLPGIYSLTARSLEEVAARSFLIDQRPDVVVDIVDSSSLHRHLYLAVQFMELGVPLVLAFNMSDVAAARGLRIDHAALGSLLGVPIVPTVGHRREGIRQLLEEAVRVGRDPQAAVAAQRPVRYGPEVEPHVAQLAERVARACGAPGQPATAARGDWGSRARWFAVKLLEDDPVTAERLRDLCPESCQGIFAEAQRLRGHLERVCGDSPAIVLADRRYGFIAGACAESVRQAAEGRRDLSDRIDAVLTHRWLGLPLFAAMMYLVFQLTFAVGAPCVDLLDRLVHQDLAGAIRRLWPPGADSPLRSLLVDGVLGGVGAVVVFVPLIALLFLAISLLEDTGYMARAAFIMDRLMHRIGLHGKSFIPLLIGFGCSVPAILATRTLEGRRDRLTTMLVVPLMSCGARLPIYTLFIPAFFPPAWRTPMLWLIYVIGIALAIGIARLLRSTLLKGESAPFVMELPPYQLPAPRGLLVHVWERTWMFLRKAGTIIFALAVLLWAANSFPRKPVLDRDYDALARQARRQYLQQAADLGRSLGLPGEDSPLGRALEIELERADRQERYWPGEGGYLEARHRAEAQTRDLLAGPDGAAVGAFLSTRDQVLQVRQAFDQQVTDWELRPGDIEYQHHLHLRDDALARIARADPNVHRAVVAHLDESLAPFQRRLEELRGQRQAERMAYTVSGRVGRAMEPLLRPCGFDWRIATALVGALGAKEAFVTQMGIVYSLGEKADQATLQVRLREAYDPLVAFCIMLFCLVSAPCLATIVVTARESGSWRWAALQLGGMTALAYVLTAAVYQVGRLVR